MEKRILTGKQQKPQGELKERLKKEFIILRNEFESTRSGDYELIFPVLDKDKMKEYEKF